MSDADAGKSNYYGSNSVCNWYILALTFSSGSLSHVLLDLEVNIAIILGDMAMQAWCIPDLRALSFLCTIGITFIHDFDSSLLLLFSYNNIT